MRRRTFLQAVCLAAGSRCLFGAWRESELSAAERVLSEATASGQVQSAVLHVRQGTHQISRAFGAAQSPNAMFLLGSITKPIAMTALMTQYDLGKFSLDDPVRKFLPGFTGEQRDRVTIRHLLTHTSGLPDQLADNARLRREHAGLNEFVQQTLQTPLAFAPGSRYLYSSMGILLASRIAELLSGKTIADLVQHTIFEPLELRHSAAGLGKFRREDMVPLQTDKAAPESGAGDPSAKNWDWNSPYWRGLGAPWGGFHLSAPDLARFLLEFTTADCKILRFETAQLMIRNHNPAQLTPRGLGFNVGTGAGSVGCSALTFGHTGSTGTIAWSDPATQTICVVLTSLPGRAVQPHPRELAANHVAAAVN